jgi:hypothetical protein
VIIESGFIVAGGLLLTFWKRPWAWRMAMLSNPLFMDLLVFSFLTLVHWGTFSGVMVASLGALICSALISLGRWPFGYIERKVCQPGLRDIGEHLSTPSLLAA